MSVLVLASCSSELLVYAGPALGGVIVKAIGFNWMLWIIAIINLGYAPLLYFLRNPPGNEEKIVS